MLDLWDSAPKPAPSAIILFRHSDREICRILEHEHDFSNSAFRFVPNTLPGSSYQ